MKQAASATGSSRYTSLATYNAGLVFGTIGNVDARLSVLIDQVGHCLLYIHSIKSFSMNARYTDDPERC